MTNPPPHPKRKAQLTGIKLVCLFLYIYLLLYFLPHFFPIHYICPCYCYSPLPSKLPTKYLKWFIGYSKKSIYGCMHSRLDYKSAWLKTKTAAKSLVKISHAEFKRSTFIQRFKCCQTDRLVSVLHVFTHRLNKELNAYHNPVSTYSSHVCKMAASYRTGITADLDAFYSLYPVMYVNT